MNINVPPVGSDLVHVIYRKDWSIEGWKVGRSEHGRIMGQTEITRSKYGQMSLWEEWGQIRSTVENVEQPLIGKPLVGWLCFNVTFSDISAI